MGVALAALFLTWFASGAVMVYRGFPSVSTEDRLQRSPSLDPLKIRIAPIQVFDREHPPSSIRLAMFDGRPAYWLRRGQVKRLIYADTGEEQLEVSSAMAARLASAWVGQPAELARTEIVNEADQWTLQVRTLLPAWKFSWPDGRHVYVSRFRGEVIQYTTPDTRFWAYLGSIPHWLYFAPLRRHTSVWAQFVIWSSGLATLTAIIGIAIGIWTYSPSKRYLHNGTPSRIPYHGLKRWHTILASIFGIGAVTWAFSGMLSMDPFPIQHGQDTLDISKLLQGRFDIEAFAVKSPSDALAEVTDFPVRELELTSFLGEAVYLATGSRTELRIVPVRGSTLAGFGAERIAAKLRKAIPAADLRMLDHYDAYYMDRLHPLPLPVVMLGLNDGARYYIDPKTARILATYSSKDWVSRWLYHGLHSLNFPLLYGHRPLWDIVVLSFMLGGTALCVTSLLLAWRVLQGKLSRIKRSLKA